MTLDSLRKLQNTLRRKTWWRRYSTFCTSETKSSKSKDVKLSESAQLHLEAPSNNQNMEAIPEAAEKDEISDSEPSSNHMIAGLTDEYDAMPSRSNESSKRSEHKESEPVSNLLITSNVSDISEELPVAERNAEDIEAEIQEIYNNCLSLNDGFEAREE